MPPTPNPMMDEMDTMPDGSSNLDKTPETEQVQEPDAKVIKLDKSVPEIADAFEGCKVGDMYKVTEDEDDMLTLEAVPADQDKTEPENGEREAAVAEGSPGNYTGNPAVDRMVGEKMKR